VIYADNKISGDELDTAVAIAIGAKSYTKCVRTGRTMFSLYDIQGYDFGEIGDGGFSEDFKPSQNWQHGGPLIDRYGICLEGRVCMSDPSGYNDWTATVRNVRELDDSVRAHASSPLVAAMRALVALKLGKEYQLVND